jgi:hypothetical protein
MPVWAILCVASRGQTGIPRNQPFVSAAVPKTASNLERRPMISISVNDLVGFFGTRNVDLN